MDSHGNGVRSLTLAGVLLLNSTEGLGFSTSRTISEPRCLAGVRAADIVSGLKTWFESSGIPGKVFNWVMPEGPEHHHGLGMFLHVPMVSTLNYSGKEVPLESSSKVAA